LQQEKIRAATKLQSVWRGRQTRKQLEIIEEDADNMLEEVKNIQDFGESEDDDSDTTVQTSRKENIRKEDRSVKRSTSQNMEYQKEIAVQKAKSFSGRPIIDIFEHFTSIEEETGNEKKESDSMLMEEQKIKILMLEKRIEVSFFQK
jgi:hypothetical protein